MNLLYGFLTISFLLCVLPISNAAPALAADLTINKSAPAPTSAPTAVYNWGGFYAGVNAGFGISNSSAQGAPQGSFLTDPNAAEFQTLFGSTMRDNQAGLLGGGTIGYNFQINSFVLGLEADLDLENNGRTQTFNQTALPPLSGVSTRNGALSNGWVGTVRPRVGYAFDRALLYFTGGLAYGQSKSWLSYTDNQFYSWAGGSDRTNAGWALGGGVEYALTQNIRVKAEYLYVNLGSASYLLPNASTNPIQAYTMAAKQSDAFSLARVGLNYAF